MPIDPNLIGNYLARFTPPPPAPDPAAPLERLARIQALKNGFLQQQAAQQQLQSGALELQEKQDAISGRKALGEAIRSNIAPGPNGMPVIDHAGVITALSDKHPELIEGYRKGMVAQQESDANLAKTQLANQASLLDLGTRAFTDAKDQPSWDHALGVAHGLGMDTTKLGIPDVYTPEAKASVVQLSMNAKDQAAAKEAAMNAGSAKITADTKAATEARNAQKAKDTAFINAFGAVQSQDEAQALRDKAAKEGVSPSVIGATPAMISPTALAQYNRSQMTAEQRTQADQAALNAKVTQQQGAARLAVEQQNAGINAKKFAMEFGGDAVKGWAKQVADNPDTANQVPPALRTPVMQQFTTDTGLPFPKPLTGTAVDQERASRNALDAITQVKAALADPEIQSRIGPILGRLGNAEQSAGVAVGLSPAAAAKAQQLRTNMRYLVFQEGKALLGGRMPQQLMEALEQSSPNVKMDTGTLNGALAGVTDAAQRNLDQSYKQRFGEKATRPGAQPQAVAPVPDAVKAVLAKESVGLHTLSDGSKWIKAPDGTITKQ